jgi:hypothetical protein
MAMASGSIVKHFDVLEDICLREIAGWMVAEPENSALAGRLIEETCNKMSRQKY